MNQSLLNCLTKRSIVLSIQISTTLFLKSHSRNAANVFGVYAGFIALH